MYLFEYLLTLSKDELLDIQTSLNTIAMLPMLIKQYAINNWRTSPSSDPIKEEKFASENDQQYEIIMNGYVTLIRTTSRRRKEQAAHYKMYQSTVQHQSTGVPQNEIDPTEFLKFFDDLTGR